MPVNSSPGNTGPNHPPPSPAATAPPDALPYLAPDAQAQALAEFLEKHVTPYDAETDDYDRPPFAADIKEGKNDPIYNAHSYHTKVPPRGIIPYILHYTRPGDVVLDPFCGSGMTGVAAQMCASPPEDLLAQFPELKDRVGPRACILNDLSPAACHIAYNYNTPVDVKALKREFERIKAAVKDEFDWLYGSEHYEPAIGLYSPKSPDVLARLKNPPAGAASGRLLDGVERTWELISRAEVESRLGYAVTELPRDAAWGDVDVAEVAQWICIPATIEFTVWSDRHKCEGFVTIEETSATARGKSVKRKNRVARGCGDEIVLWDAAVDQKTRSVLDVFHCPGCGQTWKKRDIPRTGCVPVITRLEFESVAGKTRALERKLTLREREIIAQVDAAKINHWYPRRIWNDQREMWRGGHRDAGIETAADFYTKRSLRALAMFWHQTSAVRDDRMRRALQFLLTSISGRYARTTRYLFGKAGNSAITGTLYVASFTVENSLARILGNRWPDVMVALQAATARDATCHVRRGSATALTGIANDSVDYVFTDPPFGSNLFYGDCSFLWESWLDELTDLNQEAVWNKSVKTHEGGKTLDDYGALMAAAFREMFRVLKPGRWATVEFNNSDGRVFDVIKQGVIDAGFQIANMLLLDKSQKSFKQVKGEKGEEDVVDKDVLFNLHKPAVERSELQHSDHDLEHQVTDAVREHLLSLPERIQAEPGKYSDEHRTTATINSMLMNTLIPRGVNVERLNLPFIERVCSRYFRKIGQHWYLRGEAVGGNGAGGGMFEEEVAVRDGLSAIDWLRQKLRARAMLVGELKPLWMRAVGLLPAVVSQTLDLEELLAEHFWRDAETNRWHEPTGDERERMNDDRAARVLHDAERYLSGSLRRQTGDLERADWIDVLFKACRQVEEGDVQAAPALRHFDAGEGYRLITRLFQSVLSDHVSAEVFTRAKKQAGIASNRVSQVVRAQEEKQAAERRRKEPTLFD